MTEPHNWVIIKTPDCYKVLGGWSGGYLDGDSWQLNSGIKSVTEDQDYYYFKGWSSSIYKCRKLNWRVTMAMGGILDKLIEAGAELMDENTDWMELFNE